MNKSEIAERARFEKLRQSVVQLASGNMAIAQMIDAEFGRFGERAIAESQAPQPVVGMCARLKDEWFPLHQKPHKQLDNCLDWKPVSSETANRELGDGEPSPPPGICPTCGEELRCANEGCGLPLADHFQEGFCNEQTDHKFQSPICG